MKSRKTISIDDRLNLHQELGSAFLDISLLILLVSMLSVSAIKAIAPEVMERFCYASNGIFIADDPRQNTDTQVNAGGPKPGNAQDPPLWESWDEIGCISARTLLHIPTAFGEEGANGDIHYLNHYSFTVE